MTIVTAVEADGVPGQEPPHHCGDGDDTGPQQQMKMVGNQGPRVTDGFGTFNGGTQPFEKRIAVLIIKKNLPAFDTAHDNMVQGAGSIYARLPGHGNDIANLLTLFKFIC